MATTYELQTLGLVTPYANRGPKVGIGCKAIVRRGADGAVTIQIWRGDGQVIETFIEVASETREFAASVPLEIKLGALDFLDDFTPRHYLMKLNGDGANIAVTLPYMATEPYGPP